MIRHGEGFLRAAAVPAILAATLAASADEFRLKDATVPAPFTRGAAVDVVLEASAVEPIGDGRLVLVDHDKLPEVHVVDLKTGRIVGEALTSRRFAAAAGSAPKWEGMAVDSDAND